MLAQKERGLELSEQFDEKILQVLARVIHSAFEFPLYAWAHARRNWSVMRRITLKLHPPPGLPPGISYAQYAVWHVGRLFVPFP